MPFVRAGRNHLAGVAAGQDVGQVELDRPLQLLVGAGLGVAVVPPAPELGGAGAPALHVVVGDLDHQLGVQRLEGQVLLGVPARRHAAGDPLGGVGLNQVLVARRQPVGGQLVEQLAAPLHRERGRHPDMPEPAPLIVEAQQQGADHRPLLCQRKPATTQSAVRSCLTLNITRWSSRYGRSGGLAMTPSSPPLEQPEPALAWAQVVGQQGAVDRRLRPGQDVVEGGPALGQGPLHQRLVAQGEQVEGDQHGRGLGGQEVHPGGGRVDALEEGLEVEAGPAGDDDLAVDHATRRQLGPGRLHHLGEVAGQRPLLAAAQLDLVAVAEDHAAEPVPLGLVQHPLGQDRHRFGQHDGSGHHGQVHAPRWCHERGAAGEPRRRRRRALLLGTDALLGGPAEMASIRSPLASSPSSSPGRCRPPR